MPAIPTVDWNKLPEQKRRTAFAVDGRSRIGKRMREVELEIVAAFRRPVTEMDRGFIRSAVRAQMAIEIAEIEFDGRTPSAEEWQRYMELNQILDRNLRRLGFRPKTALVKNRTFLIPS